MIGLSKRSIALRLEIDAAVKETIRTMQQAQGAPPRLHDVLDALRVYEPDELELSIDRLSKRYYEVTLDRDSAGRSVVALWDTPDAEVMRQIDLSGGCTIPTLCHLVPGMSYWQVVSAVQRLKQDGKVVEAQIVAGPGGPTVGSVLITAEIASGARS